ncbi:DNA primase [Niveispirillum cyanobacteriorum]|nr:DNA primase [Niveispirillum cyanobacteriorum]
MARDAEAICRQFLPNGRRQGRYWLVGDVQGHRGRRLYVRLTGPRSGSWTDAATGEHGDLLDLIALNRGLSFRDAMAEAQAVLRLPLPVCGTVAAAAAPTGSPEACQRLFAASKPLPGTLAERYLAKRGIVLHQPEPALRFHPRCHRWEPSGTISLPALIAAVTDDGGHVTGLHRTWLGPDGDKAALDDPRRAMGHLLGNAGRFGFAGPVMAAGEGLETVLSLRQALPFLPAVAALSAAHLAAWTFPALLRRLYVVCDADPAGEWAFARPSSRGHAAALTVLPLRPRLDDLNSDLMALREWIIRQLAEADAAAFHPGR